jgi:hypothetical protein
MLNFLLADMFGNNADNGTPCLKRGVGDDAHQSDMAAAINDVDAAPRQLGADGLSR